MPGASLPARLLLRVYVVLRVYVLLRVYVRETSSAALRIDSLGRRCPFMSGPRIVGRPHA
jgi:hypothetical protein